MIVNTQKGKRIMLIEPRGNVQFYGLPIALGFLKSNISDHHEVKIIDCSMYDISPASKKFREEIDDFKPHVVGVSCSMQTYKEGILAIKTIKSIDAKITTVMGGAHPTIFPDMIMENKAVDFLFRGESELSFSVFLDILQVNKDFSDVKGLVYRENGKVVKNEINLDQNIDKIKIPDYAAIKLNDYIKHGYNYGGFYGKTAPIWVTRGCPYKCTFCSASLINGLKIRCHSMPYMVNWITHLYNNFDIRQFAIIDDNFTFIGKYSKEFCKVIINLIQKKHFRERIYFATPNGVRFDKLDEETLTLMKQAGWQDLTISPESGSLKTLKRMRKKMDPDIVPGVVDLIKKTGLDVRGNFMIFYPGETIEDIRKTIELIRKCNFDFFQIGRFMPIPGTPVFNELVRDKEIPPDYMPPQFYSFIFGLGKRNRHKLYAPKGLNNFNTFYLYLREIMFLVFRNPYSLIFFLRYYGIGNVLKKIMSLKKMEN